MNKNKKILLIGGTGYIGTVLYTYLKKKGYVVSSIDNQVYGKKVNKGLVDSIHKYILGSIKPDLTFILKVNMSKALQRLNKRKSKNRYDKFHSKFYQKVHNGYLIISKRRKNFIKVNTGNNTSLVQKKIFDIIQKKIKLWKRK